MKNFVISAVSVVVALLLIPLWTVAAKKSGAVKAASGAAISEKEPTAAVFHDSFKLLNHETGEISKISATDYIIGVVSAEMPALYETEALKAQAVAAYTFACYKRDTSDTEYDVSTDFNTCQGYSSPAALKEKWGENYDTYYTKIEAAVKAVSGELLCYDGKTALTVYHAISSGKTNACSDVWGKELPYLRSVESIGDKLSKDYISTVTLTKGEVCEKLGVTGESFSDIKKLESGLISSLSFGGKALTGSDVQSALDLRSAAFDVAAQGESFTFTVYGYGHGVGMSQAGADYMAKQGSTYKEILYWYYPGTEILGNG